MFKNLQLALVALVVFALAPGLAAAKGDSEGLYSPTESDWPEGYVKPDKVDFYLPFHAGRGCGTRADGGSHSQPSNKDAIDFPLAEGTDILASADGIIMKITNPDGGAQCSVGIYHSNGEMTWYIHIQHNSAKYKLGDFVWRGDVVCLGGKTGTGYAHLHFSINDARTNVTRPIVFKEEGSFAKGWVSENENFAKKNSAVVDKFNAARLELELASSMQLWDRAYAARESALKLKPDDKAEIRLKTMWNELDAYLRDGGTIGGAADLLAKAQAAKDSDAALAWELANIGAKRFKKDAQGKDFQALMDELKASDTFKETEKTFKAVDSVKKKVDKAVAAELAAKPDIKPADCGKIAKAYRDAVAKGADDYSAKDAVNARADYWEKKSK